MPRPCISADTRMKTKDNSFAGFPACWNMVVLVLFALKPNFWVTLASSWCWRRRCSALKFVHPVRTERWRGVTAAGGAALDLFAGWAAWGNFAPDRFAHFGLLVTSLYLVSAGILQQLLYRERL